MSGTTSPIGLVRKACGLTQAQVARRLYVSVRTYQRIEAGGGTFEDVAQIAAIFAAILGRPVSAMYELHGLPTPPAREPARLPAWLSGRGDRKARRADARAVVIPSPSPARGA